MREHEDFLGDGVFASVEHGMIWLRTPRETGWHEIALEPVAWANLVDYVTRVSPATQKWHRGFSTPLPEVALLAA